MIRIVTLEPYDPEDLAALSRTLYQAYGLGTEHAGSKPLPAEAESDDGRYDAAKILSEVEPIKTFADDKVLYLTSAPIRVKPGPLGEPPSWCYSIFGGDRAVLSTGRIPARGASESSIDAYRRRLARESIHAVGHLWELHHCYDPRCAMHPSWSPNLPENPEQNLCTFCRDKSERRIRMSKT